ncbi:MAG: hypothetical protein M0R37_14545 [Bacteroidales bacterium]|jgi:hypothetical protein|nr:hypothetical protein [Bacteroidales bacterium]
MFNLTKEELDKKFALLVTTKGKMVFGVAYDGDIYRTKKGLLKRIKGNREFAVTVKKMVETMLLVYEGNPQETIDKTEKTG